MKREPRLQFSDADLAEPKLEKPIKRVKKAEAKADKAQAKIPKKTVVKKERGFDPATGKVKTQLRFEEVDKKKPPSKLTHAVQDAPANLVLSQVHREVAQSEDDNVVIDSDVFIEDCHNTVVKMPKGKLAVLNGLDGFIVAEKDNVLLVCKKEDSSALIRKYVNEIQMKKGDEYV